MLFRSSGDQWGCRADANWLFATSRDGVPPAQGWKLHISGTILSAREILARALPVLLVGPAAFKVTRDCPTSTPGTASGPPACRRT